MVCPGELDQQTRAVTGGWTVEFIRRLNFDVAFVSAAGITLEKGLSTARSPIADVLRAARAQAGRTVGLVDATKFGRAALVTIARAQDLDEVVTDAALDAATRGRVPRRRRRAACAHRPATRSDAQSGSRISSCVEQWMPPPFFHSSS